MKKRLALVSGAVLAAIVPIPARAASFLPRFEETHASLSAENRYQSDIKEQDGRETNKKRNSVFKEVLGITSGGYVYRPELFSFATGVQGEMSQQRWKDLNAAQSREGSLLGYSFLGNVLPQKPLHAQMLLSRQSPLQSSGGDGLSNDITRNEVELFYTKRPQTHSLMYFDNILVSFGPASKGGTKEQTKRNEGVRARLNYSEKTFSSSLTAEQKRDHDQVVTTNEPTSISRREDTMLSWSGRTVIDLWSMNLGTQWARRESTTQDDRVSLTQGVTGQLPWNFRLNQSLSMSRQEQEAVAAGTGNSSTSTDRLGLGLTHELFKSLRTEAKGTLHNARAPQGDSRQTSMLARTNYRKSLRGGEVRGGLGSQATRLERLGRVTVSPEMDNNGEEVPSFSLAAIPGTSTFLLRLDADPSTITVKYDNGSSNGMTFDPPDLASCDDLACAAGVAGGDWSVVASGAAGGYVIRINTLPADIVVNAGRYEFFVTYTTHAANYTLQNSTSDFTAGATLFGDLLVGDYRHTLSQQEVVDGDPGSVVLSPEVTVDAFSLRLDLGPLVAGAGYEVTATDYTDTRMLYSLSFGKDFTSLSWLKHAVAIQYQKTFADFEISPEQRPSPSSPAAARYPSVDHGEESRFRSILSSSVVFPSSGISLGHEAGFESQRGSLPRLLRSEGDILSAVMMSENDRDVFNTGMNLVLPLPRTGINLNLRANYVDESMGDGAWKKTWRYSGLTGYAWQFGQTRLSVNGNLSWEDVEGRSSKGVFTQNGNDRYEILCRMTRLLF